MPRYKTYKSAAALERAVEKYFNSISRETAAVEMVPSGRFDDKGHEIYTPVAVKNADGEEIKVTEWYAAPSITALCLKIGISLTTWENYAKLDGGAEDETNGYAEVVSRTKERIRAYLENELLMRKKGSTRGIEFALSQNYGMSQKTELELGERAARAISAASMTPDEKLAIIKEAAELALGGSDDEGNSESSESEE